MAKSERLRAALRMQLKSPFAVILRDVRDNGLSIRFSADRATRVQLVMASRGAHSVHDGTAGRAGYECR